MSLLDNSAFLLAFLIAWFCKDDHFTSSRVGHSGRRTPSILRIAPLRMGGGDSWLAHSSFALVYCYLRGTRPRWEMLLESGAQRTQ